MEEKDGYLVLVGWIIEDQEGVVDDQRSYV